jgi:hypothetical protein
MQFVEKIEDLGVQKFEIDLFGFGFLGFSFSNLFLGKLIKIDLYLHEHGKAAIRSALVNKLPKFEHNRSKQKVSFKKVPFPINT